MISSRIIQLRNQIGWSQLQLARELHVNLKTIRNWENGDAYPSAPNIVRLCELFSVTSDYLLGLDNHSTICLDSLTDHERIKLTAMIQVYINLSKNKSSF